MASFNIPAAVPAAKKAEYLKNFRLATKKTGRLMLFAGDQKIEHLNADFSPPAADKDDMDPEHLFRIASQADIGVFASQLGLISAYGNDYKKVPYLVKLNSKTNLLPTKDRDPLSLALNTVKQVIEFKKQSKLKIVGVGYTIYPGSAYESQMLAEAGRIIHEAHQNGLLAVIWAYPRGGSVKNSTSPALIAGAAGLGASLGADFVKVVYPEKAKPTELAAIIKAAGRSGVIFSGGKSKSPKSFLASLKKQIKAGARGNATGRNIHQKSLAEAVSFANAITAISCHGKSVEEAYSLYEAD